MTGKIHFVCFFLVVNLLIHGGCEFEKEESFEATGYIRDAVAVGGETTGWVIELDEAVNLEGKLYSRIDVESQSINFEEYRDEHVEVSGEIKWREGLERGRYPVLFVHEIKRLR